MKSLGFGETMKAREADLRAEQVVSEAQELFGRSMLSSGVSRSDQ